MKKIVSGMLIVAFVFALGGCVSSGGTVSVASEGMSLDEAITEAARLIESKLAAGNQAAVLSFASNSEALSQYVVEELTGALVEGGKLTVVDRARLDLIRKEMEFQISGEVSDASMQSIGQKLGAQAIISGNFMNIGVGWRFQAFAIVMETAQRTASYRTTVVNDSQVAFLMSNSGGTAADAVRRMDGIFAGKPPAQGATVAVQPASPQEKPSESAEDSLWGYEVSEYWSGIIITGYNGKDTALTIPAHINGLPVRGLGIGVAPLYFYSSYDERTHLTSVIIPNSVKRIYPYAFQDCTGLTSIIIPNSVTEILHGAFSGCTGLSSVNIHNGITEIDSNPFPYCTGLTAINVAAGNPAYSSRDGILFSKSGDVLIAYPGGKKGSYSIPSSVTEIGDAAFEGCTELTSVVISDSVTEIGEFAFGGCTKLISITIPPSVTTIWRQSFSGCTGLSRVTIGADIELGSSEDNGFTDFYNSNGRQAGTYRWDGNW